MDLYGIIGYPVKHSLSPAMHNAAFKELNIDSKYQLFELEPENLKQFLQEAEKKGIKGLSVTIPHKVACMKFLDEISNEAQDMGAVNTIKIENGKLSGENYDWIGVRDALLEKITLSGKKVVMIGAGGAARAAAYALNKEGVEALTILVRTPEKYAEFYDTFRCRIDTLDAIDQYQADIVINATPIGMKADDPLLISENLLKPETVVFDMVYKPLETKLIQAAKKAGSTIITGEKMLLFQALKQFQWWTGEKAPYEIMQNALNQAL